MAARPPLVLSGDTVMRCRGRRWWGASAVLISGALMLWAGVAEAGTSRLFPVQQHLVPALVALVFMLPALLAGALSALSRLGRGTGTVVGVGLAGLCALAVAVYLDPRLIDALRV